MNAETLKKILSTFSDQPDDLLISSKGFILQMQGNVIECKTKLREGSIFIIENSIEERAEIWIKERLAQLPLLARRILDYTEKNEIFISPGGRVIDFVNRSTDEKEEHTENTLTKLESLIGEGSGGLSTDVVYLTSDAGEGKTTLINEIARKKAKDFLDKKTDHLVLPIPLGGRTFMRLDDIISGVIINKYRFRHFYYDGFIEMVKLGFIVPALDGFEEMFVVDNTGEAISSLGSLISRLDSQGRLLIAARKAFFEYYDFEPQAYLLDSIKNVSASFVRVCINRWNPKNFIEYLKSKGIKKSNEIYTTLKGKLGAEHPLLTRAMLVKRIAQLVQNENEYSQICDSIDGTSSLFLTSFLDLIIERELKEKWLERSEEGINRPLIDLPMHHELLSDIALEMVKDNKNSIPTDSLNFVAEVFCERKHLHPNVSKQIISRINDYPLLNKINDHSHVFDHDEFKNFFLGEALGRLVLNKNQAELRVLLRKQSFPNSVFEACMNFLEINKAQYDSCYEFILKIAETEFNVTFARENSIKLLLPFIFRGKLKNLVLTKFYLSIDSFHNIELEGITFSECYFTTITFEKCSLKDCIFQDCKFDTINIKDDVRISDCKVVNSTFYCLNQKSEADTISSYDPKDIECRLMKIGFSVDSQPCDEVRSGKKDLKQKKDLELVNKAFRLFSRTTNVGDELLKIKLGHQQAAFFRDIMPKLISAEVLEMRNMHGHDYYRLLVPMSFILKCMKQSGGFFDKFLELVEEKE